MANPPVMTCWHFSRPYRDGSLVRLHAAVPGTLADLARRRLMASDPFWCSERDLVLHQGWVIDGNRWRCRPVDRIVAWLA